MVAQQDIVVAQQHIAVSQQRSTAWPALWEVVEGGLEFQGSLSIPGGREGEGLSES